jgi:hypothetical protein
VPSWVAALGADIWLAAIPGAPGQRRMHRAQDIERGKDLWKGETRLLTN